MRMPKTLGEWLFLASKSLFSLLVAINPAVSILGFIGSLALGFGEGFDTVLVFMTMMFAYLLIGDLASIRLFELKKIFKSTLANLFVVTVRGIYLFLAGLLFWGIFWDGGLQEHYWICLIIAFWLTLLNLPLVLLHLALCVPKWRIHTAKLIAKTRCICSEECDCQNPPTDD